MKNFVVDNLVYRVYNEAMTFSQAKNLCVNGWDFPTVSQLQCMGDEHYIPGNKRYLHGSHNSPKLYWLDGIPKNPFGKRNALGDTEYDRSNPISGLYDFDLSCCFHMNSHSNKSYLILVKKI
jgi:hypothetical protein